MMRRRDLLVGAGALGVAGLGYRVSSGGLGRTGGHVDPVTVQGLDAPGSTAGRVTIPVPGTVTLVDVFATWCRSCDQQHRHLTAVHDAVDGVAFVSVTTEVERGNASQETVRRWWRERDGGWQVVLDEDLAVTEAVGATGVPFTAVIDANGDLAWTAAGVRHVDTMTNAVREAIRRTASTG